MKYRNKPVVIEAFKWTGDPERTPVPQWIVEASKAGTVQVFTARDVSPALMTIDTLEGKMRAEVGDYIIKGVNGEIYPCKPDIFERTYEDAESVPPQNGACMIAVERARQAIKEGYDDAHDDAHDRGELLDAGLSYIHAAINITHPCIKDPPQAWPWDPKWWKPAEDRIRNLVIAGALIAAEIDRLLRIKK